MKKAQSAMDFIITYSWAIFSVFAVIGILAYFGVLSPEKYIADECVFLQPGFKCISHKIGPGSLMLSIENLKESEVEINSVSFDGCIMEQKAAIIPNQDADISFSGCSFGEKGDKFKGNLDMEYKEKNVSFSRNAPFVLDSIIE